MSRHVAFLTRLLRIWSAFNFIIALALGAFAVAAASLAISAREPPGGEIAAGVTAASLAVVALAALVWGAAHHVVARGFDRRHGWARNFALALAIFNLLLLPLGTGLGVYMLWVLLHEDVRREFLHEPPPAT